MSVPCEVTAGQVSVRGISLGGVATCLHVPQFNLLFDVGTCPRALAGVRRLFITHGHGDHAGGLISMLSHRTLYRFDRPLQAWAPAWLCDDLRAAVQAYERMQGLPYEWNLTPVEAGSEIPLEGGRFVRAFDSVHVIPTLGYTVWERVRKLKAEFRELPGPEIARRKHAGEPLFDEVVRPLLSFCGDTTIDVLDRQPHLLESRVLVLEATYLDERRTPRQCHQHGHVHLEDVLARAGSFRNKHYVMTHFSQNYSPRTVREILAERFAQHPEFSPSLHPLLPPGDLWPA